MGAANSYVPTRVDCELSLVASTMHATKRLLRCSSNGVYTRLTNDRGDAFDYRSPSLIQLLFHMQPE